LKYAKYGLVLAWLLLIGSFIVGRYSSVSMSIDANVSYWHLILSAGEIFLLLVLMLCPPFLCFRKWFGLNTPREKIQDHSTECSSICSKNDVIQHSIDNISSLSDDLYNYSEDNISYDDSHNGSDVNDSSDNIKDISALIAMVRKLENIVQKNHDILTSLVEMEKQKRGNDNDKDMLSHIDSSIEKLQYYMQEKLDDSIDYLRSEQVADSDRVCRLVNIAKGHGICPNDDNSDVPSQGYDGNDLNDKIKLLRTVSYTDAEDSENYDYEDALDYEKLDDSHNTGEKIC